MRNKNNGVIGEQHHFVIPEDQDIDEELRIYGNRANPSDRQVKVHGVDVEKSGFGFCGNQKIAKILTERIPTRFGDSKILNRQ